MKNRALLLSGGGFRGAIQVPILERLFQEHEYDAVYGVSVGAINGAMFAQHDLYQLRELWEQIDGIQKFLNVQWYWPFKGLLSMDPLRREIEERVALEKMIIPFYSGIISGTTGEYFTICSKDLTDNLDLWNLIQGAACLAGIMIPGKFNHLGCNHIGLDGGYENIIPIPDQRYRYLDVVACKPLDGKAKISNRYNNVLSMAVRGLKIFENETFQRDLTLLQYNSAEKITVYAPQKDPGDFLDASRELIDYRFKLGEDALKHPAVIRK